MYCQTYEWNDKGLLVLSKIQDSLCFTDKLVGDKDVMKGVLQESDLCEYIRRMIIKTPSYLAYYTVIDTQVRFLELIHTSKDQNLIRQKYENF